MVRCDEIGMTVSNEMIMEGSVHHLSHASFFFQMKLGMKIFRKTSNLFKMWGGGGTKEKEMKKKKTDEKIRIAI